MGCTYLIGGEEGRGRKKVCSLSAEAIIGTISSIFRDGKKGSWKEKGKAPVPQKEKKEKEKKTIGGPTTGTAICAHREKERKYPRCFQERSLSSSEGRKKGEKGPARKLPKKERKEKSP